MNHNEMKQNAWNKVSTNYPTPIIYYIIPYAIFTLIDIFIIGTDYPRASNWMSVLSFLIFTPFAFALPYMLLKYIRTGEKYFNIDRIIKNIGEIYLLEILMSMLVFLFTLLLIIPGIIKAYAYSMTWYLMADEGVLRFNALKKSEEMMRGYKMDLFVFQLSFIGWWLLCGITFGLALVWVLPYYMTAQTYYYENLKAIKQSNPSIENSGLRLSDSI